MLSADLEEVLRHITNQGLKKAKEEEELEFVLSELIKISYAPFIEVMKTEYKS